MSTTDRLAELLASALRRHDLPGAVLGVRAPGGTAAVAAGVADTSTGEQLTVDHSFRLMSVVKPAVGLAFARLVDTDRLAWADTAGDVLPELRDTGPGRTTVDQLLGMTAGLAEVPLTPPPTGDTPSDLVRVIATAGLADPPGTAWSYSNPAFGLLGRILEVVGGGDWRHLLSELVLQPSGMTGATVPEEIAAPLATEHVGNEPVAGLDMAAYGAAGTRLCATIADVLSLGDALLQPDASPLRVQQAVVPVPYLADAWCRGIARFDWPEATAFGWDGIGVGVRNLLRVIPDRDIVVALTVNSSRGRLLWNDLVPEVVDAVGGGHVPALRFEPSGESSDHTSLVGSYERKGLPPAVIASVDGDLVAEDLFGSRSLRHVRGDVYRTDGDDVDWPTVTLTPGSYYSAGFHYRRI